MKVTYQSKYIGIDTILIYLNKELKKYNKNCCTRVKYIHKLIKKVKKGSI